MQLQMHLQEDLGRLLRVWVWLRSLFRLVHGTIADRTSTCSRSAREKMCGYMKRQGFLRKSYDAGALFRKLAALFQSSLAADAWAMGFVPVVTSGG